MRIIPTTMATQHPDNASAPRWEENNDGFVSIAEEIRECEWCFSNLGTEEFMWDWEGKYADEAVIDKLFEQYYDYFKKHELGRDIFLTFRLPNVWKEKGYSLLRALMVILTSEEFARDLKLHTPPLFEAILPMTERAEQLIYIQDVFQKLARFKMRTFTHSSHSHTDMIRMIPLVEGVLHQLGIFSLLERYNLLYKRRFRSKLEYVRPFLARSDPALASGLLATALANKLALSEIRRFSEKYTVPCFPIIGVGSLPFRGGLSPDRLDSFMLQNAGMRTVTIQSAFRYDFSEQAVARSIKLIHERLPMTESVAISQRHARIIKRIVSSADAAYQKTLTRTLKTVDPFFSHVPRRRERRLHVGFLSYDRTMGTHSLPRAITFTAAFYSLGIPPELIGLGKALADMSSEERRVMELYYPTVREDIMEAGRFLNRDNLARLASESAAWRGVARDIERTEGLLGITCAPGSANDSVHINLSSNMLLQKNDPVAVKALITEMGILRKSLG